MYTREQIEEAINWSEGHAMLRVMLRQLLAKNDALREYVKKANAQAEHFEREWYLRGDELDALLEDAERLDWMESKGRVSIERVREGRIDGPLRWDVEFGHDGREAKSKKGFRQAIDAARKKG